MLKVALVSTAEGLPNVAVPGPLNCDHAVVTAAGGFGRPSSVTVPLSAAALGKTTVCAGPALTTGAWFCGGAVA